MGFSWNDIRFKHKARYRPLIIAHRGASGSAPENTIAALRKAVTEGADAVECDVRLTNDKQIVVIHDATLRRTTSGRGYVSDHPLETLRSFDAGSWFHRSFAGERIPTLKEVLECIDGRVGLNIEIKSVPNKTAAKDIVQSCLTIIRKFRAHHYVLLTSFQHSLLKLIKQYDPSALVGLLYHPFHHGGKSPIRLAQRYDAGVSVCAVRFLRKAIVVEAHRHNIAVAAYTVNNRRQLKRCLTFGIEAIVTNVPGKMVKFLEENYRL